MAEPIKPKTQKQRVLAVMKDGEWHTLWGIRADILKRFHKLDSETAISARLRDLRGDGCTVNRRRYGGGQACEYRLGGGV